MTPAAWGRPGGHSWDEWEVLLRDLARALTNPAARRNGNAGAPARDWKARSLIRYMGRRAGRQ